MTENLAPETSNNLLGGRYRLGPVIGRGGMGAVYRSMDQLLDREVAVKVFRRDRVDAEQLRRQHQEIATLARLNHPGLVALYDAGSLPHDGGTLSWLVMELIPGTDLGRHLEAGPLDLAATARLGAELGDTLGFIHRRSVVHRDVKPGNIVMARYFDDEEPRPKLADFGIARMLDGPQPDGPDASLGTAAYLSPEQVRGADVGPPSDVYSLGLVLLQCLTGQVEYPGPPVESALARLACPPGIPAGLGSPMAGLLAAMTSTDPRQRPDCLEVARTLRRISGRDGPYTASGRTAPAASSPAASMATARLVVAKAPGPDPLLPVLQTSQLTNATLNWSWPVLPERPLRPPSPAGQPTQRGSGSKHAPRRHRNRLLRLALLASVVMIAVAAALIPGAALIGPETSRPGTSPSPTVPALLDEHLRQLEESLTP
ncbi:serine/threonine-protein kinase [Arthrobacter mobilis]|uniref:non-specific serine/threonine protein kinase n=1 Tax=Arthrobacter mobilis TaxID=2724944 RepID=A0A7X6K784_9MICC|nr:serine/threonine-protein kinase [Arthrobacter mobilis]NKX56445.1 serine/threonine protein kinase [Arthrobacter mobilis]